MMVMFSYCLLGSPAFGSEVEQWTTTGSLHDYDCVRDSERKTKIERRSREFLRGVIINSVSPNVKNITPITQSSEINEEQDSWQK